MTLAEVAGVCVRVGLGLGTVYLMLCAILWAFQERLIFHPRGVDAPPTNPAAAPVEIDRGEVMLRGWLVNEHSTGPVVVYFGGNAEEVSWHVDAFARRNATTLLVNYRGYGDSGGVPSEQALVEDAVALAAWAKAHMPDRPLVLFGLSLGTGVVALATARAQPDALVLVSPYRSVERIARQTFPWFPVRWMLRHPLRAESAVADMPRALVFASPVDAVIPFAESEAMVEALGERARLHTFALAHGGFLAHQPLWEAVDAFLAEVQREAPVVPPT